MEISAASIGTVKCLGSQQITSGDLLLANAGKWSGTLTRAGATEGRIVGLALPASPEFFSALFGIWQTGACALVVDPGLSPPERDNICRFTEPVAMVAGAGEAWPATMVSQPQAESSAQWQDLQLAGPAPALALLTSGTTGEPKIVILSFAALKARITANIAAIGTRALGNTLQILSLSFGHGLIGSALTTLMAGGTLVLPSSGPGLAMKLGSLVDRHAVSFMTSVPAFWHMVLKASPPPSGGQLKRLHVGSAPLSKNHWEKIVGWAGCPVFNCYGMTETANWVAATAFTGTVDDGAVGCSLEGEFAVIGEDGASHASGTGEVLVRSAGLMSGYFKQPEATALALRDGWYRTGDVGRLDERGFLTLVGRQKEEINLAGSKVQPVEVDQLLETHPDIVEACTFAVPDTVSGEAVATAVVVSAGKHLDGYELTSWCLARARKEIVPVHWFFVEQLCRTGRGKLDRAGQRKLILENGK